MGYLLAIIFCAFVIRAFNLALGHTAAFQRLTDIVLYTIMYTAMFVLMGTLLVTVFSALMSL